MVRVSPVALGLAVMLLLAVPNNVSGNHLEDLYCSDSTALGEPEYAHCFLEVPASQCPGGCEWPDIHIRVWASDDLGGDLTPIVTGDINFEGGFAGLCQDFGSCEYVHDMPAFWGSSVFCQGYGLEDGEVFAITEAVNAASSVHMECWTE